MTVSDDAIRALLAAAKKQKSRQVKSAAHILAKQLKLRDQIPEKHKLLSEIIEGTIKWLEREMDKATGANVVPLKPRKR